MLQYSLYSRLKSIAIRTLSVASQKMYRSGYAYGHTVVVVSSPPCRNLYSLFLASIRDAATLNLKKPSHRTGPTKRVSDRQRRITINPATVIVCLLVLFLIVVTFGKDGRQVSNNKAPQGADGRTRYNLSVCLTTVCPAPGGQYREK